MAEETPQGEERERDEYESVCSFTIVGREHILKYTHTHTHLVIVIVSQAREEETKDERARKVHKRICSVLREYDAERRERRETLYCFSVERGEREKR